MELADLARRKELVGGQKRKFLHRATRNGVCISSVPHRLNGTELSQEEFEDNLRLIYGLIPQDIPTTCNGCGKRFSIEHTLSLPKGSLFLEWHYDGAKEWDALGYRDLVPSDISYEPKINSRTVQRERTRARAQQDYGTANIVIDSVGESQGGSGRTVKGASVLERRPGQVEVPAESMEDVSGHGLCKRGTSTMFDIRSVNIDAGS